MEFAFNKLLNPGSEVISEVLLTLKRWSTVVVRINMDGNKGHALHDVEAVMGTPADDVANLASDWQAVGQDYKKADRKLRNAAK